MSSSGAELWRGAGSSSSRRSSVPGCARRWPRGLAYWLVADGSWAACGAVACTRSHDGCRRKARCPSSMQPEENTC